MWRRYLAALAVVILSGGALAGRLQAQQAARLAAPAAPAIASSPVPVLATVPDSIRVRAGYRHWFGGAFGFLVGLASPRYRWVPSPPPTGE